MNIGQVGTKYAYDNLEAYKEGYQQGRKDAFDEAIKKVHEYWTAGRIRHSFLEALAEDFEMMKEEQTNGR